MARWPVLDIFSDGCKTYRYRYGSQRKLSGEVGGGRFHVSALPRYFRTIDWGHAPNSPMFQRDIRSRLTRLMTLASVTNKIEPGRIGANSIRTGGENEMFVAGYGAEIIMRLRRRQSDAFTSYLRASERVLSPVGAGVLNSHGLSAQL